MDTAPRRPTHATKVISSVEIEGQHAEPDGDRPGEQDQEQAEQHRRQRDDVEFRSAASRPSITNMMIWASQVMPGKRLMASFA